MSSDWRLKLGGQKAAQKKARTGKENVTFYRRNGLFPFVNLVSTRRVFFQENSLEKEFWLLKIWAELKVNPGGMQEQVENWFGINCQQFHNKHVQKAWLPRGLTAADCAKA